MPESTAGVSGTLTDGTGVSRLTSSKIVKDLVLDFLLSGSSALVTANVMSLGDAIAAPQIAGLAVAGSLIRVVYRFILRWASS